MVDKLPSRMTLDRRTMIKNTSMTVLGSSLLTTPAFANETVVDDVFPGSTYQNGTTAIADVPLDSRNEHYLMSGELYTAGGFDANGEWQYRFDLQGHGTARRYYATETPEQGWDIDRIASHSVQLSDESGYARFKTATSADYLGGYPTGKYTAIEITMDIVEQLAYAAAGRADNYVDGVINAADVYETLENGYDENKTETGTDSPKFVWYYSGPYQLGDKYANIGHHVRFEYGVDYGWEPYAYIDQQLVGVNASPTINWRIQSHSESSTSSTNVQSATDTEQHHQGDGVSLYAAETMSRSEKRKFGVKLVPRKVLEAVGFAVPDEATVDGDMVWFMSEPPFDVTATTSSNVEPDTRKKV